MSKLSRRSVLRGSVGLAAIGTLARPFIAKAAGKTASIWWTQGFVPEEDASFRAMVAEYEKTSGNKIDVSIIPFAPIRQKIVSALTSGDVPDVMANYNAGLTVVPQNAWNDKLVDLTDVVDTQKSHYHPTALLASQYYNNITKTRSLYYAPLATIVAPLHIWSSLVEKAGYKMSDAPKTWARLASEQLSFTVHDLRSAGKSTTVMVRRASNPNATSPADTTRRPGLLLKRRLAVRRQNVAMG